MESLPPCGPPEPTTGSLGGSPVDPALGRGGKRTRRGWCCQWKASQYHRKRITVAAFCDTLRNDVQMRERIEGSGGCMPGFERYGVFLHVIPLAPRPPPDRTADGARPRTPRPVHAAAISVRRSRVHRMQSIALHKVEEDLNRSRFNDHDWVLGLVLVALTGTIVVVVIVAAALALHRWEWSPSSVSLISVLFGSAVSMIAIVARRGHKGPPGGSRRDEDDGDDEDR